MKHRVLTTVALAVLACAAVASTATGAGNGRLFQFRGQLTGITLNSLGLQFDGGTAGRRELADHRVLRGRGHHLGEIVGGRHVRRGQAVGAGDALAPFEAAALSSER